MGILKHVVLPLFCIWHVGAIVLATTQGKEGLANAAKFPRGSNADLTQMELHFLGSFVGISLALLLNDLSAILTENSHYRAMATAVELVIIATDAFDGLYLSGQGFDTTVPIVLSVLAVVGLVIHSMEPGILTKDRHKND